MSPTLIIQFAKAPVLGEVKTRMQPVLNQQQSLELHQALCSHQLAVLQASGLPCCLATSGEPRAVWLNALQREFPRVSVIQQQGRDLGERMAQALKSALQDYQRCIIVGSDCPFIDVDYLLAAERALSAVDCVIGPAFDGGYVLIGLRRFSDGIFSDIAWGTATVCEATLLNLQKKKFTTACLDKRRDIDRPEDLKSLQPLAWPLAKFANHAV